MHRFRYCFWWTLWGPRNTVLAVGSAPSTGRGEIVGGNVAHCSVHKFFNVLVPTHLPDGATFIVAIAKLLSPQ